MSITHELTAYHGWAFDRHCWKPWERLIPDEFMLKTFDRGYSGKSRQVSFSVDGSLNIVMAHSYGAHLCPSEQIEQADAVILFGAFRTFHPRAAQFQRRSRQMLKLMKQRFQDQPEEVLKKFMENTYHPAESPEKDFQSIEQGPLLEDLYALDRSVLDFESLMKARKICILHGAEDGIVAKSNGRELYDLCRDKATYFEIKDAGHALPFTHAEQCWSFIQPEIEKLVLDPDPDRM